MKDKKLVKVEFTYEDGKVETLEGDDAENWLEDVNSCVFNAYVHGQEMKSHPWKESNVKQD